MNINKRFQILFAILLFPRIIFPGGQTISINEVMFDPKGSEYYNEFIEIFNLSDSVLSLEGCYLLIDGNVDTLKFIDSQNMLLPGSYGLILDRDYIIEHKDTVYNHLIPGDALLLTIHDKSFSSSGLVNSTAHTIYLIAGNGDTLSAVVTTPGQNSGYSDEKILLDGPNSPENWGNSISYLGTPGFKNSISPRDYDVAIIDLRYFDDIEYPTPGEPVRFLLKVQNLGLKTISNAELILGEDTNRDTTLQDEEIFYIDIMTIKPGNSAVLLPVLPEARSGVMSLLGTVLYDDDNSANNSVYLEFYVPYPKGCMAINEFMYTPDTDGGGEWIEILNVSGDTVNLKNWTIADNSTRALMTDADYFVPPGSYVVIASDSVLLEYWDVGEYFIKSKVKLPALNDAGDSIVVRDLCGQTIDALKYSSAWGKKPGVSLERINPYIDDQSSSNWSLSGAAEGGTPGKRNSVMVKNYDLAMDYIETQPQCAMHGESVQMNYGIKNTGMNTVYQYSIRLTAVLQAAVSDSNIVFESTITVLDSLESGNTHTGFQIIEALNGGAYQLFASVICQGDEFPENNRDSCLFAVGFPENAIVINEFMYTPDTDGGGEWIEILNVSGDTVNLKNWTIADNSTRALMTDADYFVPPESYVVIASDSVLLEYWDVGEYFIKSKVTLPALTNTGDSIVVRDLCGQTIDALEYSSAWGKKPGVSLERINPYIDDQSSSNWNLSGAAEGGTPGKRNSIMVKNYDLEMDSLIILAPNIIIGDSVAVKGIVRNRGLNTAFGYLTRFALLDADENAVFDSIVVVNDSLVPGEEQTYCLDIALGNGGIFQVLAVVIYEKDEDVYNDSDTCFLAVGYPENSLIINEIMYMPETGEAEWFEIFNPSSKEVDLNRWEFRDANGKWRVLINQSEILLPESFAIVAARQDFLQAYPNFDGLLIVPDGFPVINNTSDSLFLCDAINHPVERVYFEKSWGGAVGNSLERKDPNVPALTENNWGSSVAPERATPGYANSILKYQYDLSIIPGSFRFVDSTVSLIDAAQFQIEIKNSGSQKSKPFSLELFHDTNLDSNAATPELVWSLHNIPSLPPDSTIALGREIFSQRSGRCRYLAIVTMIGDENIEDNIAYTDLLVGYPPGTLVLNEFLAYPTAEQTEFIEFVNIGSDNIQIADWFLANKRSIAQIKAPVIIKPGEYLVLVNDSSTYFNYFPPSNAVVLALPKWPGLNNMAGKILLKDLTGTIIDSVEYDETWGLRPGISMEKKFPDLAGSLLENWTPSNAEFGATPGMLNSITPPMHDLSLDSVALSPAMGDEATEFTISLKVSNIGLSECPNAIIHIFDKQENITGPIISRPTGSMEPGKTDSLSFSIGTLSSGLHTLIAGLDWAVDQNAQNDSMQIAVRVSFESGALLLSEFMAMPGEIEAGGNSVAEYVEVYNPRPEDVYLKGWFISDENTDKPVQLFEDKFVSSRDYFVIASDSTVFQYSGLNARQTIVLAKFPSLNNEADCIVMKDPTGRMIDSLRYSSGWGITKNSSHERVFYTNPNIGNNWRLSTSLAGGTPGLPNSVAISKEWKKPGIKVEPNPFSPNGDGIDDEVAILFQIPFPSAKVTVEIYDMMGRLIYQPAKNVLSSSEGVVYWNGASNHSGKTRIGMYVVRCTATDSMSDQTVGYVTTLVLAR
ncbi:MAG TPA: hypothetical protein DHW42_02065 [Candidatus Marinimicrobia bacterium]|nr:hypothetical protein [Candidatus Neomarinimicrobiota bacterium]